MKPYVRHMIRRDDARYVCLRKNPYVRVFFKNRKRKHEKRNTKHEHAHMISMARAREDSKRASVIGTPPLWEGLL